VSDLAKYIHYFKKLNRSKSFGGAPHKPILLLAVINQYRQGNIESNRIYLTPELIGDFKFYWSKLVTTNHHPHFYLPFYHMKSEPFWELIANPGCEKWLKSRSPFRGFNAMKTAVNFAQIDFELAKILLNEVSRDVLLQGILENYFAETKNQLFSNNDLFNQLSNEILNEDPSAYQKKINELKSKLDDASFEEEVFVRSGAFKRGVSRIYGETCAISNLRINATKTYSVVDACHIVPFSESQNDHITNGIALCPNLHRAFDRGLISIDDNYRLLVSKDFNEPSNSPYGIKQFEGKELHLPENEKYYPLLENLSWHRTYFGFS
jgi:putative restriction endonuclease